MLGRRRCGHCWMLAAVIVCAALPFVTAGAVAETADRTAATPFEIVLEGPPGPYPYGHVEYRVTVYEGALADAPPEMTSLAAATEQAAALTLPHTIKVEVAADKLAKAIRPEVGAVVVVARRPAYWSNVATPLERAGSTRVKVIGAE